MLWTVFIFNKSKTSDTKNKGPRYQLVQCYDVSKTSYLGTSSGTCYIRQSHWGTCWYITTKPQIGSLKQVRFIDVLDIRCNDVSVWSRKFKWVTKVGQKFFFFFGGGVLGGIFFGISSGSASLKCRILCHYNVSKTSVTFRYMFWPICDVLSSPVLLKYQLVSRYNVLNWLVLSTF